MKKTIITYFVIFSGVLLAQTSVFKVTESPSNQLVSNGAIFYHTTKSYLTVSHEFEIKNISAATVSLSLRKYDDLINTIDQPNDDMGHAYFCFGTNCLPASVFTYTLELGVGESVLLDAKFDEASIAGHSSVRYKINDKVNTSDALTITLNYDTNVGLKESGFNASSFSEAYPNPAKQNVNIDFNTQLIDLQSVRIINASGQVVQSNFYEYNLNTTGLQINTSELNAGLYFVNLMSNKGSVTKKIVIN